MRPRIRALEVERLFKSYTGAARLHLAHLRPQLHHACGGGHKEQREDTGEKHAHLFYILQLDQPEVQGQQQQHKPVHTGRNRQRQYGMTYFPQKAKREDTRKLKQIIRKKSPLSNS